MRKATSKSKPKKIVKKKAVKKTTKKPIKKITKKPVKKVIKKKTTKAPAYIQSKKLVSKKDVPIPFQDTEDIPHHLLRTLIDIYYDFQGQRIQTQLRIGASEREHSLTKEELSIYGITTILENSHSFEKDIEKLITKQLKNHALYTQYLSKISGIGPMLSAGLIAYIDDIEKFQHVSSLWQYSGYGANRFCPECKKPTSVEVKYDTGTVAKKLHPFKECPECHAETIPILQKRQSGYQSNWNDKLKTLCCVPNTMITGCPEPVLIQNVTTNHKVLGLNIFENKNNATIFDGQRNRFRKVEQTFERKYEGEIISITPHHTNIPLKLTPEHPVLAVKLKPRNNYRRFGKKGKPRWIEAKELTTDHAVIIPRIQLKKKPIDIKLEKVHRQRTLVPETVKMTERLAFLIGLYLAEGWCMRNTTVLLGFHKKEKAYRNRAISTFRDVFNINGKIRPHKDDDGLTIQFYSKPVAMFFKQNFGTGAKNKRINDDFLGLEEKYTKRIVQGFFCGDGSILGDDVRAVTASLKLAHEMTTLVRALGYTCGIYRDNNAYRIVIAIESASDFCKNVLNIKNTRFKPTYSVFVKRKSRTHFLVRIKSIDKENYSGKVYNMETEIAHTYTAEGILVHNCWKAGTSFVKQSDAKSKYRKLYDQIKKKERRDHPQKKVINGKTFYNDGHIHNRAMRKVVKIFLAHVWQTWRRQQGLEATEPYAKQLLGHSTVEAFTDK